MTDRISLGLFSEHKFSHKLSRSISIDRHYCNKFINLGRPIFSLNHSGASAATVFTTPTTFGIAHAWVLHSRWAGHPIFDPSRIIATWFSYCSINPLRPQNCIYLQSDLSCLYKLNCNIFNHHERLYFPLHRPTPAIRHFFWLVVIAGDGRQRNQIRDCAMTWASHVLQKICRMKIS